MVYIVLPTPSGPKQIKTHIVGPSIPFLIGLDVLDAHRWNLLTVQNELESVKEGWKLACVRTFAHIYLTWDPLSTTFYSKAAPSNFHPHFMHPSVSKLYNLLRRATPERLDPETKMRLKEIYDSCHICQTYSTKPLTFQARCPDEIIFNKEVRIDLMFLQGKPVIHVVDTGTNVSAARFLPSQSTDAISNTFMYCWVTIYTGYPPSMLTDQGSAFRSEAWKAYCKRAQISRRHTGTESHNSHGPGESYHAMLRRVFNRISMQFPTLPTQLRLPTAVKAVNDTAGPNGLVPSLLQFGSMPSIPQTGPEDERPLPNISECKEALCLARKEYGDLIARHRVQNSLNRKMPSAAHKVYTPGQQVYVYRERKKHWEGPFTVIKVQTPKSVVLDVGRKLKQQPFNVAQIKPAKTAVQDGPLDLEQLDKTKRHTQDKRRSQRQRFTPSRFIPIFLSIDENDLRRNGIMYTKVISPGDPRTDVFDEAKRKQLAGLFKRGTFHLVLREEVGLKPNIIPTRFVLSIKRSDDDKEVLKARFVLGGHRDREKSSLVHTSTTLWHCSVRILIALAVIFGFDVWSSDVTQAYLQSVVQYGGLQGGEVKGK